MTCGVRRGGALVLAVLCVGSLLGEVAHHASTQHAVCAEHGEAVHVDARSALQVAPEVELGLALRPLPGAEADHEHEHCLACEQRREASARAPLGDAIEPLEQVAEPPGEAEGFVRTSALYVTAPKTSPPA